ncbi:MAG: VanZ family protein [Candidatus Omnitrophica bacterium]|nr:VanZ family protein [Candidatus Omnitrophota bacterium]
MNEKILKYWFPVILYSGIIWFVSSLSRVPTIVPVDNFDKIEHIIEYCLWGWLLTRALIGTTRLFLPRFVFLGALLIAMLFAASDEIHQYFVPGRCADVFDWLADTIGSALGAAIFLFLKKNSGKVV